MRFSYDSTKIKLSNLENNIVSNNELEYFKFETEFQDALDMFTIDYDSEGEGIRAIYSFNSPVEETEHIIEKEGIGKVVNTDGGVLIGKMSFQMTEDTFDASWFKLVESENASPKTGIKINIDGSKYYEAQSTFRFVDATASKDASLSNLIMSTGMLDEVQPENSTYKEYTYTPIFNKETFNYELELLEYIDTMNMKVTTTDSNATMKVKVPKRDIDNKLIYDTDGITIIYEEKNIQSDVPFEILLNKLGESDTIITIDVTAEDEKTTCSYEMVIKRPCGIVKGKIYTEPTSFTTEKHIAEVLAYLDIDIVGQVDWETAINNTKNYKSDNLNSVFRGDIENGINGIKEKNKIQTNDDGTFEMYLIPGKYTVLIDKKGYLDQYYININIVDKGQIDLSAYETSNVITLMPGDINKDGTVGILDKTIMTKQNGKKSTDSDFNSSADVNDDDVINITDKTILTKNNNSVRKIIDIGGIS